MTTAQHIFRSTELETVVGLFADDFEETDNKLNLTESTTSTTQLKTSTTATATSVKTTTTTKKRPPTPKRRRPRPGTNRPTKQAKQPYGKYQHISAYQSLSINDHDRTARCGRIRLQPKFAWLQQRSDLRIHCHPLVGRLQVCDFVCASGHAPRSGPSNVKCYFFRDRKARLSTLKPEPVC